MRHGMALPPKRRRFRAHLHGFRDEVLRFMNTVSHREVRCAASGKATQTLVHAPAMIHVFPPVLRTVSKNLNSVCSYFWFFCDNNLVLSHH